MIELLKMVSSANFIIGAIVGAVVVYVFRPLIDSALGKLFKQND